MEVEFQRSALRPCTCNLACVGVDLSVVGAVDGIHLEVQFRILQRNSGDGDTVRSLINTVERGLQTAVSVLGDVQNKAEFSAAGFKGSIPVAHNVLRGRN